MKPFCVNCKFYHCFSALLFLLINNGWPSLYCVCDNTSLCDPHCSFHRFPSDFSTRARWFQVVEVSEAENSQLKASLAAKQPEHFRIKQIQHNDKLFSFTQALFHMKSS